MVLLTSPILLLILFSCETKLASSPTVPLEFSKAMNSPGLVPGDSVSSVTPAWASKGALAAATQTPLVVIVGGERQVGVGEDSIAVFVLEACF